MICSVSLTSGDQIGDVVIFVKTEDELVDIEYSLSNLKPKLRIYLYYQN